MPVVIDDRLLLEVLLGDVAPEVAEDLQSGGVYTAATERVVTGRFGGGRGAAEACG